MVNIMTIMRSCYILAILLWKWQKEKRASYAPSSLIDLSVNPNIVGNIYRLIDYLCLFPYLIRNLYWLEERF